MFQGFERKGLSINEGIATDARLVKSKYSTAETIGFLKGKSAIKIFDMYTELKRRYWGCHYWSKGYCVSTIGLDEEQTR